MRRALPAISTRSAAGCARSALDDLLADRQHGRQQEPLAAAPPRSCWSSASRMFCSAFGPRPGRSAQALALGRLAQLLERRDAELVVDLARRLRARGPGCAMKRTSSPGNLLAQLRGRRDLARLEQRRRSSPRASCRRCGSSVARPSRASCATDTRRVADRPGRLPVGDDAVDDRPVQLVEVGQLVQRGCDLGVLHRVER